MRETIGSTWIYQLVIVFILIFVSFLILALTYSKNFKTKNEILNIIEKYEGVTKDSVGIINNYLSYTGYQTKGHCPKNEGVWIGSTNLNSTDLVKAVDNNKYYYCIKRTSSSKPTQSGKTSTNKNRYFYEVVIFYKFNLPVLGDISTFSVNRLLNITSLHNNGVSKL